ncbi:Na+/H+ antiporter family protein [Moritella marina ATCC 15381]|uniref:Na+/H+ antiporter family protein n=1 Tax=Moritella marina ATCC 15381 TaxID=1202962 RepID=A0A5J6WJ09_MORMI|nr:Na+/H+ antiporter family protein [Moritella marina]QFI38169.1 Na+/H+ antiporter family protein [Moritella marina ATCC 15381]
MNPVVIAVLTMLILSFMRINVVVALTISAILGGLIGGLPLEEVIAAFNSGLGGGASIALNYAMLGAFAVAISKSGITDILAAKIVARLGTGGTQRQINGFKYGLLFTLLLVAISSQNVIPVHIAFIPLLVPPLLGVMNKLRLDRRAVACVITFGLTATYMFLPIGFGGIFLNNILLKNLNDNGANVVAEQLPTAMALPVLGMVIGLITAVIFSYRKPREYLTESELTTKEVKKVEFNPRHIIVAMVAVVAALSLQLIYDSIILGALTGFIIFTLGGVIKFHETQDIFTRGVHMMAMIGFIMIAASGFSEVMKATSGVESLVGSIGGVIGDNKGLAALLMLITGLLVTMGIGSSFSTIPILATIYVPLALQFGFSPLATASLVGTAAALGDAGSPASDSTLGPTSGLNVDGQHDHIRDSVIPTFIHYNIPLIIFGWIAAVTL